MQCTLMRFHRTIMFHRHEGMEDRAVHQLLCNGSVLLCQYLRQSRRISSPFGIFDSGIRNVNHAAVILARQFLGCLDIFLNGDPNIREGFFFRCSLRPAAGQTEAQNTVTFLGTAESDAIVCHGRNVHRSRHATAIKTSQQSWSAGLSCSLFPAPYFLFPALIASCFRWLKAAGGMSVKGSAGPSQSTREKPGLAERKSSK
jgi:hypothetical protein